MRETQAGISQANCNSVSLFPSFASSFPPLSLAAGRFQLQAGWLSLEAESAGIGIGLAGPRKQRLGGQIRGQESDLLNRAHRMIEPAEG